MSHVGKALDNWPYAPTLMILTRRKLAEIKRKAIRRGVWFTVLSRVERACVDLTVKVVNKVRSLLLTKVLTAVVEKIRESMEDKITRLMREVGYKLALKISRIAQAWGNSCAIRWAGDLKFVKYLTIIEMNTLEAHKT